MPSPKRVIKIIAYFLAGLAAVFPPLSGIAAGDSDGFAKQRKRMVQEQLLTRGIEDKDVLHVMRQVPRHLFVPKPYRPSSYADRPLPIGKGQTISQPYIVAFMTEALRIEPEDRVLEIGTGSGYQAAVLAELAKEVYTIEIIEALAHRAGKTLNSLGYSNIEVKVGNGYKGWPEKAPFDRIIVTCAPEEIPRPLVEQLKQGGRLVIPVGKERHIQRLILGVKKGTELEKKILMPVRFVPMVE